MRFRVNTENIKDAENKTRVFYASGRRIKPDALYVSDVSHPGYLYCESVQRKFVTKGTTVSLTVAIFCQHTSFTRLALFVFLGKCTQCVKKT